MKIVVNAGHTKMGVGTGANGYLNESKETRKIACELMKLLADSSHEIIPAIIDKSSNNLKAVVDLANSKDADLFISIHLNAGGGQGSEIYTWNGKSFSQAYNTLQNLNKLGFKSRGIKDGSGLYVIKNTKMNAMLIEVCFVDNKSDADFFKKIGYASIANAIYKAI